MLTSISNTISYILCLNEEAKCLVMSSMQELIKSECSDFMVYRVVNGNTGNLPDYEDWQEAMEIDKNTHERLHLNLCQKIGRGVRRKSP